ncbi:3-keto-disaccharide hydrolase [Kriegella aquimaris]|uniref:3-keto-alpha-glucoside-1,2-lyase/3-keto-2-hydroxy-glucal hydratase domain-containing protein n=1 Tax=Kriegella aquimaris TaxID=192904 RepID=A0A1G9WBH7_9FLAO|nr:DUF1080 domain-containing protein [Kriegella aquimaris]SDM81898.1 protein of unknown function [Kriegella aquimaris]
MKNLNSLIAIFLFTTPLLFAGNPKLLHIDNGFLGMWTFDIDGGGIGWLNVHQEKDYLDAELLWIGGSVTPVSHVYLADENTLVVTRTNEVKRNDDRKHTITSTLRITRNGDEITGTMSGPSREGTRENVSTIKGKRLAPVGAAPDLSQVKYGKKIKLFNGKDLSGWRPIDPKKANGFKVENGQLINNPVQPKDGHHISYGNIRTEQEFKDFNLKLEVNVPKGNNSGVYLRGLYEIQVVDSYGQPLDSHNMGALYSRITPSEAAEKPAGEWQTLDITLVDRHVTVIFNGKKIIDNQPVDGPTGGAISSDVFAPGPIYLQGDHGNVAYRNIVLTPVL